METGDATQRGRALSLRARSDPHAGLELPPELHSGRAPPTRSPVKALASAARSVYRCGLYVRMATPAGIAVESKGSRSIRSRPSSKKLLHPPLLTEDVRALQRIAVPVRLVSAAVDHAECGLDAEVGVAHRPVVHQRCRATLDVETVVCRPAGDVAL
jgi:hypothetical protein